MNNDERRLHDWLDGELDRMSISGDRPVDPRRVFASDTDRALFETANELRRLDAGQSAEPSAGFLQHLENQLMASNTPGRSWSGAGPAGAPETLTATGQRFLPHGSFGRRLDLTSFATLALVCALIVASAGAFFAMRGDEAPGGESPRYAALGSTPEAIASNDISASFAPEPTANWTIPFPDGTVEASTGRLLVRNGLVYRQLSYESNSEDGYFNGLQAIDASTGEIAWEFSTAWSRSFFAVDGTNVYTTATPNRIAAHDAFTGEIKWANDLGGTIVSGASLDGVIYLWQSNHEMTAIRAGNGAIIWTAETESAAEFAISGNGTVIAGFEVAASDDGVAAITADGTIVVFDLESGDLLWRADGYRPDRTQLAITDGVLLSLQYEDQTENYEEFPTTHGVGFDLATGAVLYGLTIEGPISTIVTPGGTEMFHFIADEVITRDSPDASGETEVDFDYNGSNDLWTEPEGDGPYGENPPVGADFVFGIDAQTGNVNWKRSAIGEGFGALYSSYASSERLWALTYDNQIVLLNGEQGMILDAPVTLENPVKDIVPGTVEEGIAVQVMGGALLGYGAESRDQQG